MQDNDNWFLLTTLLSQQVDQASLNSLLQVLLTPEERDDIGSRLAIMRALLARKESQRQIAKRLSISITKVTRCSNYLKTLHDVELLLLNPPQSE